MSEKEIPEEAISGHGKWMEDYARAFLPLVRVDLEARTVRIVDPPSAPMPVEEARDLYIALGLAASYVYSNGSSVWDGTASGELSPSPLVRNYVETSPAISPRDTSEE